VRKEKLQEHKSIFREGRGLPLPQSSTGKYYALLKVRGKQIKRSLGTDNLPTARRVPKDFMREQERIHPETGRFNVQSLIEPVSSVPKTPLLWPEQLRGDHLIDRVTRGTAFKQLGYSDR
jgi:hypothetical protein